MRLGYAVFAFEEMDEALSRPPLAAVRALQAVGIVPKAEGWASMPHAMRLSLATHGSQYVLDLPTIQSVAAQIPPRFVQLVGARREVEARNIPSRVVSAMAGIHRLTEAQWQALHPFERFTLDTLSANARLIWRALDEMARLPGHMLFGITKGQQWIGQLARCELLVSSKALSALAAKQVLEGRALDLARATGRRAARRSPELLDAIAGRTVGPVELESTANVAKGEIVWQAHVSADDGEFLPDASLLAVTSAATALCGMLRGLDPGVRLVGAAMREEPWPGNEAGDEQTKIFVPR